MYVDEKVDRCHKILLLIFPGGGGGGGRDVVIATSLLALADLPLFEYDKKILTWCEYTINILKNSFQNIH